MLKPDTLDDLKPVDDCDCVIEYPAAGEGYAMLYSRPAEGGICEENRTPLWNLERATRYLLETVELQRQRLKDEAKKLRLMK